MNDVRFTTYDLFGDFAKSKSYIVPRKVVHLKVCGEGGIRTRDTLSGIHTFQACSFNRSDTSPKKPAPGCFGACKEMCFTATKKILSLLLRYLPNEIWMKQPD